MLGPTEWDVAEALLGDSVEPGEQEVEAGPFHGRFVHADGGYDAEGALQVGLYTWRNRNRSQITQQLEPSTLNAKYLI